ncbi:MAG: hypothetical protein ABR514_09855 [Chthoniobacterales bacterium]
MNGPPAAVEIIRPFSDALELMKRILFQPFDAKKWFVVGFSAWLSHLGGGFNFRFNRGSDWRNVPALQSLSDAIEQIPAWLLMTGVIVFVVVVLTLLVLFAWLRARGRFMFVDCIVKNRGAVVEPWREFRRQGNSHFLFALVVGCVMLVVLVAASVPFMLPILRGTTFLHLHDLYLFSMIALWGLVCLFLVIGWNLISHFMVAIMYRRRCLAVEACRAALTLISRHPGAITLYCLFWIALGIGAAVVACMTILFTCCVALVPYIGTVIMLPIFACLRGYGLCFIRQFGPEYDVWSGIGQPPPLPPELPLPP